MEAIDYGRSRAGQEPRAARHLRHLALRQLRPGEADSEANTLNASQVATIIRSTGWQLWGNRTCSPDPAWQFLFTVRVADRLGGKIVDALQAFERDFWLVLKNEVCRR